MTQPSPDACVQATHRRGNSLSHTRARCEKTPPPSDLTRRLTEGSNHIRMAVKWSP